MNESKQRIQRMTDRYRHIPEAIPMLCALYEEAMGERDQLYTDLDDAHDYIRELEARLEKYEPEMPPEDREKMESVYGY